eukprot:3328070-Pleurochrysis_carterae.AAC.1
MHIARHARIPSSSPTPALALTLTIPTRLGSLRPTSPWCSSRKQMRKFDDLCRYMTERHVSKYVSSTRGNSCDSFSGFVEAHEVTEVLVKLIIAIERYLEPKSLVADSDRGSDSTFSNDSL